MQDYRRLLVWSRAPALAIAIRRTVKLFPVGYADLRSQLIRAAESIPSNIVERCGAATPKEFARFLDIAIKSASEVDYRLRLARDHGVLHETEWGALSREAVEIRKMLYALRKAVLAGAVEGN